MQRSRRPRTGYPYLDGAPPVVAMAHRGGAKHPEVAGTENTLAAFRHALALGYRYLETDVHATSDGVLLAFHDDSLERVTGHSGRLAERTVAEVAHARVAGVHAVPRMVELLEEFPDACFNVDLKSDQAVEPLVDLIEETGAQDRVLVGSFSSRRLARFRRLTGGRVATSAGPREVAAYRLLPGATPARWASGRVAALQVPHRRGRLTVVTPGLVRKAHAAGLHVHVWTVDEAEEMRELLDLGVDGLITDRTDVLRDVLVARGQWEARP